LKRGFALTSRQEDLGKASFREALRARADAARRGLSHHPPVAALIAYHRGRSSLREAEDLRDHLTLCPECRELLLDLVHFGETGETQAATPADEEVEVAWRAMRTRLGGAWPAAFWRRQLR
jgi:hypothetical protein